MAWTDVVGSLANLAAVGVAAWSTRLAAKALIHQERALKAGDQAALFKERVILPSLRALDDFVDGARRIFREPQASNVGQRELLPDILAEEDRKRIDAFNRVHETTTEQLLAWVSIWGDSGLFDRLSTQVEKLQDLNEFIPKLRSDPRSISEATRELHTIASRITRILISFDASAPNSAQERQIRASRAFGG